MHDEPVLGKDFDSPLQAAQPEKRLQDSIRELVRSEPFAVLCTQGKAQPYGSVVAFAFNEELNHFVFATPTATRKYRLLSECERVALVVDNRGRFPDDMMRVEAITVTGRAQRVESGPEFERWASLLMARHPYLCGFVESPSTALFKVEALRFLHVTRFQEVRQWLPALSG
jgi:nitroimidazol reductase NimA-like FMN-containing flavoprotein (pyridoxamine 5'-phosphate oxidase superfamily)